MKKIPQFTTFSECKRAIFNCRINSTLRYGQAFCNTFQVDSKLEDRIYNEESFDIVVQKVWNFYNNSDYQNN